MFYLINFYDKIKLIEDVIFMEVSMDVRFSDYASSTPIVYEIVKDFERSGDENIVKLFKQLTQFYENPRNLDEKRSAALKNVKICNGNDPLVPSLLANSEILQAENKENEELDPERLQAEDKEFEDYYAKIHSNSNYMILMNAFTTSVRKRLYDLEAGDVNDPEYITEILCISDGIKQYISFLKEKNIDTTELEKVYDNNIYDQEQHIMSNLVGCINHDIVVIKNIVDSYPEIKCNVNNNCSILSIASQISNILIYTKSLPIKNFDECHKLEKIYIDLTKQIEMSVSENLALLESKLDNLNNTNHSFDPFDDVSEFFILKSIIEDKIRWLENKPSVDQSSINQQNNLLASNINSQIPVLEDLICLALNEELYQYSERLNNVERFNAPAEKLQEIFTLEFLVRCRLQWLEALPVEASFKKEFGDEFGVLFDHIIKASEANKPLLRQWGPHKAFEAAASKGEASQSVYRFYNADILFENNVRSSQEVCLRPDEGVVLKKSTPRAFEDEHLIEQLSQIKSPGGFIGSYTVQEMIPRRAGVEVLNQQSRLRGFTPSQLTDESKNYLLNQLSINEKKLYTYHIELEAKRKKAIEHDLENQKKELAESSLKNFSESDLADFNTCQQMKWAYYTHSIDRKEIILEISFEELQKIFFLEGEESLQQFVPLEGKDHIKDHKDHIKDQLINALKVQEAINVGHVDNSESLYFVPKFANGEKNIYERCEKFKWDYQGSIMSFKEIQNLFFQKGSAIIDLIKPVHNANFKPPKDEEIKIALAVKWDAILPEIYQKMETQDGSFSVMPLTQVDAKPFIENMILFNDFFFYPKAKNIITNRLTPEAQFNAILTGELQLLDLHANNLGVMPKSNPNYEKYKDCKFDINGRQFSFSDALILYLEGQIGDRHLFTFELDGVQISKKLADLPELKDAFKVDWNLAIFDTDLCLGESNKIHRIQTDTISGHLIPLRSVLLELDWKKNPLDQVCIDKLMDAEESDFLMRQWIDRKDAPIYQHLSKEGLEMLEKLLHPVLERYALSRHRNKHSDLQIAELQFNFVNYIVDKMDDVWAIIEQELSSVKVFKGATLESFCNRYSQSREEILEANKDIPDFEKLGPNELLNYDKLNIKHKPNLTENNKEALEMRKKIANQLLPRLSIRQRNALIERQESRKEYLEGYYNLKNSQNSNLTLVEEIRNYIEMPSTPLNSVSRNNYLNWIKNALVGQVDPIHINELYDDLIDELQPTYLNVMMSMYPLLGDAYELNMILSGNNEKESGEWIGLHKFTLEQIIEIVDQDPIKYPINSKAQKLAANLKNEINNQGFKAIFM